MTEIISTVKDRLILQGLPARAQRMLRHVKYGKLSDRFEPIVFGLFLTGMMSCLISVVAAYASTQSFDGLFSAWLRSWLSSWPIAMIAVLAVRPVAEWITSRLVETASGSENIPNNPKT